ncbi:MAG: hypothetical protein IPK00_14445 [Deltaproteobacteria bacterium]|nr:hypothetical protein [Deltaproteobacteria bacterium]
MERIEETTEANRAAAESAAMPRVWGRMALVRRPRSAGALATLARLLSGATGAARSAVLAQAGELIGEATGADRVGIHLSTVLLEQGPARDEAPTELELAGGCGERFALASSWARRGLAAKGAAVASAGLVQSSGHRRKGRREIACLGPAGCVARISLEGAAVAASGPAEDDALLEAVAGLLAGYLERDRLERELLALRTTRSRVERLAQLGRVASSSAHDFNNVLTAILGYADLLELELEPASGAVGRAGERALAARGRQELEEIRLAAARGAVLVEEVLGFSRERPSGETELDLAQSVARLDPMLQRVAGARIALEVRCEAGLPPVRLDGDRFERVLVNLVANARHAIEVARVAEPGRVDGRIGICVERARDARGPESDGDALRLVVRDDGCGMSPDVKRRIFEPFFTTRSALGGTGIGLADAADFARRAGGRIEVESGEGEGTAIALVLPAASHAALPLAKPNPARA